jgi:multiple sugar transport system ATP-binding protein
VASVIYRNVTKRWGDVEAVKDLTIEIPDGEFLVFVGPSGCGKSTSLRMLAGLEEITEGEILIGDRVVNNVAPKDRDIAMVFQSYALYPHMTVYDNMAFGLRLRRTPKQVIDERVRETAASLGIEQLLDRRPRQLSGGQRQRVAVGRAIVREPAVFLLDEPLSNLDAKLRVEARTFISKLHQRLGTTFIYVTHDQVEAMTMGQRIAVLNAGKLMQIDTPTALYDHPANIFVAGFIGSPSMNFVYGTLVEENGEIHAKFADETLQVDKEVVADRKGLADQVGKELVLGFRPEAFEIEAAVPSPPAERVMKATVNLVEQLGSEAFVHFYKDSPPVLTPEIKELLADQGGDPESLGHETKFTARVNPDMAPRNGDEARLVVDTSKIHFFDKTTGLAIR